MNTYLPSFINVNPMVLARLEKHEAIGRPWPEEYNFCAVFNHNRKGSLCTDVEFFGTMEQVKLFHENMKITAAKEDFGYTLSSVWKWESGPVLTGS